MLSFHKYEDYCIISKSILKPIIIETSSLFALKRLQLATFKGSYIPNLQVTTADKRFYLLIFICVKNLQSFIHIRG